MIGVFIADVYNMHMEQFSEFDNYTFVLYIWIQETAEKEEISAMPTFKFYKNGAKVSHFPYCKYYCSEMIIISICKC